MGLPASEVTIAEVLDDDYVTGFFEKSHFGDVEESYLHNQGFDEAIFTLYNQFAGQMFTPKAEESFYSRGYRPDTWDKKYAIDRGVQADRLGVGGRRLRGRHDEGSVHSRDLPGVSRIQRHGL